MLYPRISSRYASRSILGNSASILFVFMLLGYQAFMGYQALIHILGAEAFALYPGKWKLHALSWDIRFWESGVQFVRPIRPMELEGVILREIRENISRFPLTANLVTVCKRESWF